jgi:hypothetical protein
LFATLPSVGRKRQTDILKRRIYEGLTWNIKFTQNFTARKSKKPFGDSPEHAKEKLEVTLYSTKY